MFSDDRMTNTVLGLGLGERSVNVLSPFVERRRLGVLSLVLPTIDEYDYSDNNENNKRTDRDDEVEGNAGVRRLRIRRRLGVGIGDRSVNVPSPFVERQFGTIHSSPKVFIDRQTDPLLNV
jgi:hypothetical protein|tara:strand:- start:1936 stop:2298 length:363 start_codon:yes stop_codon:yes gene_type:complete